MGIWEGLKIISVLSRGQSRDTGAQKQRSSWELPPEESCRNHRGTQASKLGEFAQTSSKFEGAIIKIICLLIWVFSFSLST